MRQLLAGYELLEAFPYGESSATRSDDRSRSDVRIGRDFDHSVPLPRGARRDRASPDRSPGWSERRRRSERSETGAQEKPFRPRPSGTKRSLNGAVCSAVPGAPLAPKTHTYRAGRPLHASTGQRGEPGRESDPRRGVCDHRAHGLIRNEKPAAREPHWMHPPGRAPVEQNENDEQPVHDESAEQHAVRERPPSGGARTSRSIR